jgi:hypothetical protein
MSVSTKTLIPIFVVLRAGGEIDFSKLVKECWEIDPARLSTSGEIASSIGRYAECLVHDKSAGKVRFNKNARRYVKIRLLERSTQFLLHNMVKIPPETWQLYPLIVRSNSERCYLGIPWEEIPIDLNYDVERMPYDLHCDFREEGENSCRTGCRVSDEILKKYNLA